MGIGAGINHLGGVIYGCWLTCIALLFFLVFYSIGLTCSGLIFNAEIYFLHLRGSSIGLIYAFSLIFNYVFSNVFLAVTKTNLGEMITFLIMGAFAVFGYYFISANMPETKLRTLMEIGDIIRGKKKFLMKKERIRSPQNIDSNQPVIPPMAPEEYYDKFA